MLQSHGSAAVRVGTVIFGCGALLYYVLEFLRFLETTEFKQGPCFHVSFGIGSILAIFFTMLQAYIIIVYPRINIRCHKLLNRYVNIWHVVSPQWNICNTYIHIKYIAFKIF